MNRAILILGFVIGLFWIESCQAQTQQKPLDAETDNATVKTYIYKESAGKPRKIEIHFPENHDATSARLPGVILFHGGGWRGGSYTQFRDLCRYLARRGMVAATVEYRMLSDAEAQRLPAGETRKRVCIVDAKSAIRWFKQHSEELGVDADRIVTGGGSAGGHICVLATQQTELNDPQDPQDIDVSVVGYLLFNPAFATDDTKDAQIDVLQQLKPGFAPALVIFGSNDTWLKGWKQLETQLIKQGSGDSIQLWMADGQPHGFFNRDPWKTVAMLTVDRFLVEKGLLQGEPILAPPSTGEKLEQIDLK